jgi:hypothetical protein
VAAETNHKPYLDHRPETFLILTTIHEWYPHGDVTGEITDVSGLQFTIASDQLNIIRHLVSQQSLFIFTSDGEFDMSGEPVTPTNAF